MDFIPRISYGPVPTVIAFQFQPEGDPFKEKNTATNVTVKASTGRMQNNQKYQEQFIKPKFSFVDKTRTDAMRVFFETWASKKKVFTYYPHTDTDDGALTWTLEDNEFDPDRILPGSSSDFVYQFELTFRRLK